MSLNNILGAAKIAQDKIRVGDKIYALHKEPEKVDNPRNRTAEPHGPDVVETVENYYSPEEYDFYLVEREHVDIPNRAGAVIDLHWPDEVQRWLSWWDFSRGKVLWVKADNGTRQGMAFMQGRANQAERWEVIA